MKKIHSILASIVVGMLATSCDNNFDVTNKADTLVSVAINELNEQKSFNVGEDYQIELWVQRGGLKDESGKVKFVLDTELLKTWNEENYTSYELLPEDYYEMTNTEFVVDKNETYGLITYYPEKFIQSEDDYDQTKYVLPLRLKSDELDINPERNTSMLAFTVSKPVVRIGNPGVNNIDISKVTQMDVNISVPFTNIWNISCAVSVDESLIDAYNTTNKVNFMLLPEEYYTSPQDVVLEEGTNETVASYTLKGDLPPGNYILPLKIASIEATQGGVPNNSVSIDQENSTILFRIVKVGDKIAKTDWEIVSCNSFSPASPPEFLIDDDESTFWHCAFKTSGIVPPFEIAIDMKKEVTIAQIDLVNRGQTGSLNNIKWVEFYASTDNNTWEFIGASNFNDEYVRETFRYYVKSTVARYLKLVVPEGYGNDCPPAAIRELTVYGK